MGSEMCIRDRPDGDIERCMLSSDEAETRLLRSSDGSPSASRSWGWWACSSVRRLLVSCGLGPLVRSPSIADPNAVWLDLYVDQCAARSPALFASMAQQGYVFRVADNQSANRWGYDGSRGAQSLWPVSNHKQSKLYDSDVSPTPGDAGRMRGRCYRCMQKYLRAERREVDEHTVSLEFLTIRPQSAATDADGLQS